MSLKQRLAALDAEFAALDSILTPEEYAARREQILAEPAPEVALAAAVAAPDEGRPRSRGFSLAEAQALGLQAVEAVKKYVARAIATVTPRLDELEKRAATVETRCAALAMMRADVSASRVQALEERLAVLEREAKSAARKPRVRKTNGEASMTLPLD